MNAAVVTTDAGPWFPVPLWLIERVSAGAIKTYAALGAKWANRESRECHPSQKNLATLVGVSRSTVCNHLDELEAAGALIRTERKRTDGSRTSNTYQLLTVTPVRLIGRGRPADRSGSSEESDGIELEVINQNQELEHMCDSSSSPNEEHIKQKPNPAGFDGFWSSYPRKVRKRDAIKAWRSAADRDLIHDILAGLSAWLKHWDVSNTDTRYIPHASTWLNKSDYLDPPPTTDSKQDIEEIRALARGLSDEERSRRKAAGEYPYDPDTLRRLGD